MRSLCKECRREVCENPVSSTEPTVRGITDESYTMTMEKFKAKAFKKFAARRQVSYLHNNLRKPLAVSIRTCSTRLTEMNNYLRLFPGPDPNVPLGEGYLMISPYIWCLRHVVSQWFQFQRHYMVNGHGQWKSWGTWLWHDHRERPTSFSRNRDYFWELMSPWMSFKKKCLNSWKA